MSLYSVSSRAYRYLKEVVSFPLPTERTIRLWLARIQIKDGIILPVMNLLTAKFLNESELERKCILGFDEMSIDEKYCYDPQEDRILGGQKKVMVFAVRGLFSKWKQVVYYSFDGKITTEKLFPVIDNVQKTGLVVVGITHDMSTRNVGLWRDLKTCLFDKKTLNLNSSNFTNECTGKKVYIFPDYPYLLKLIRNLFIDHGITLADKKTKIEKKMIQERLFVQKDELKLTFKATNKHLNVRKKERQRVRPAFQLFSNTMSKAIFFLFPWRKVESDFFKLINDYSDLMNVRTKEDDPNPYKCAYGKSLAKQNELLSKMKTELIGMRVGNRINSYSPFQKGMLISISSLKNLYNDMVKEAGCSYIQTSHVNQDYIENVFSRLRGIGGFSLNPTAVEVKSRIKKLIYSWNFLSSHNASVESFEDEATMLSALMKSTNQEPIKIIPLINEDQLLDIVPEVSIETINLEDLTIADKANEGSQEYLSGYIAKKLLMFHPELTDPNRIDPFWVHALSDGHLTEPTAQWYFTFKKLEEWLRAYHVGGINMSPQVVKNLVKLLLTNYPEVPAKAISLFVKTRTMIKIKDINRELAARKFFLSSMTQNCSPSSNLQANLVEDDSSEFILAQEETIPEVDILFSTFDDEQEAGM